MIASEMVKAHNGLANGALPDDFAETLLRVPEVVCAAIVEGDEGADLWIIVDADAVAGSRSVVPAVGELLRSYPGAVADFLILPRRGRDARTLLPEGARTLFVHAAV